MHLSRLKKKEKKNMHFSLYSEPGAHGTCTDVSKACRAELAQPSLTFTHHTDQNNYVYV
jgi:hypothetical protein